MNGKTRALYKVLDDSIREFGNRVIASSKESFENDIAELHSRLLVVEETVALLTTNNYPSSESPASQPPQSPLGLPPLPKQLTVSSLEAYLQKQGFDVVNNRPLDGALWVRNSESEFSGFEKLLEEAGIKSKYYPEGRRRQPGPQYEIDTLKTLEL